MEKSSKQRMGQILLSSVESKFNLKDGMCAWPIGDILDPNFKFCDSAKQADLPYCEHHSKAAYLKDRKPLNRLIN